MSIVRGWSRGKVHRCLRVIDDLKNETGMKKEGALTACVPGKNRR